MHRIIGLCLTPIGGLIILYKFSGFIGSLANLIAYGSKDCLIYGLHVFAGATMLIFGIRWLKGEVGIVFISLGSLTFMVSILGIFSKLFPFYGLNTPFSIGEFIGNCILLPSSIVLVYLGISSFAKNGNKTIIDDINIQ